MTGLARKPKLRAAQTDNPVIAHSEVFKMIDSVSSSGFAAIQRGQDITTQAADRIARAGTAAPETQQDDLTQGGIELLQGEYLTKAGAKVVKAADEMVGTLLDEMA